MCRSQRLTVLVRGPDSECAAPERPWRSRPARVPRLRSCPGQMHLVRRAPGSSLPPSSSAGCGPRAASPECTEGAKSVVFSRLSAYCGDGTFRALKHQEHTSLPAAGEIRRMLTAATFTDCILLLTLFCSWEVRAMRIHPQGSPENRNPLKAETRSVAHRGALSA